MKKEEVKVANCLSCHRGTLLQQHCVCCHLPPLHTDGKIENAQKKSHSELCETGRDGGEGVTAPSGVAFPSTIPFYHTEQLWAWQEQSMPKAATVIAAFYKCTTVK